MCDNNGRVRMYGGVTEIRRHCDYFFLSTLSVLGRLLSIVHIVKFLCTLPCMKSKDQPENCTSLKFQGNPSG